MFDQGQSGYAQGQLAAKDMKGDSGAYNGASGGKKIYEDGKAYHGGNHYNSQGMNDVS